MPKSQRNFPGSRRPPESGEDSHAGGRRGRPKRAGGAQGRKEGPRFSKNKFAGSQPGGKRQGFGPQGHGESETAAQADNEIKFSDLLMQLARRAAPERVQLGRHPEPLARLDYAQELDLKNKALQEFWTARGLPDKPNRILPSPRPRGYRTTTKRRVVRGPGGFQLAFLSESMAAANPKTANESLVEPPEHKAVYAFILSKLNTEAYYGLAGALNYLIIRGDYGHLTVMFNVHRLNADVVRKTKLLGDHLKTAEHKVVSAFMFYDPSKSEFYFEARAPEGPWKVKKIFGPDDIRMKVLDRTYAFHPTAFCQVNASILPAFLEKAEQLLKPKPAYRLLDLYSGYGFFTLHLGKDYGEAWGVDLGGPAIDSAIKMASAEPATHARFRAGRIGPKTLEKLLPPATAEQPEALLLDPPRQGTEPGVIRALAARNPARVLHIFCDMDTLPKEVNQWRKAGFMVSKVVPLDMFPGTDNLEVMVLFIPDRYGILNRIDKDKFKRHNPDEPEAAKETAPRLETYQGHKLSDQPEKAERTFKPPRNWKGKPARDNRGGPSRDGEPPRGRQERPSRDSEAPRNRDGQTPREWKPKGGSGSFGAGGPRKPLNPNASWGSADDDIGSASWASDDIQLPRGDKPDLGRKYPNPRGPRGSRNSRGPSRDSEGPRNPRGKARDNDAPRNPRGQPRDSEAPRGTPGGQPKTGPGGFVPKGRRPNPGSK